MSRIRDQRGVAMVTVILVAAVLSVVSSTAAFLTIKEFRAGNDDKRGANALSYAEAGVDRFFYDLGTNSDITWGRLNEAGCALEPISLNRGEVVDPDGSVSGDEGYYDAYLTVFDPTTPSLSNSDRMPDIQDWTPEGAVTWNPAWNDSTTLCTARDGLDPHPNEAAHFAIFSKGQHPTAKRVVRQVVAVTARGLPIGLYADNVGVQGGNPETFDISLVTPGDVQARNMLEFRGNDPYYTLGHFWDEAALVAKGLDPEDPAPTAVHARGTIYCTNSAKNVCGNDLKEHPEVLNCVVNPVLPSQAQWDQSGEGGDLSSYSPCPGWSNLPPYSNFTPEDFQRAAPKPEVTEEMYAALKASAKRTGMYCVMSSSSSGNCTSPGGSFSTNGLIQNPPAGVSNNYVAYFDFPSTGNISQVSNNIIKWKAATGLAMDPCPAPNTYKSVVIVVRFGSLTLEGNGEIVGAFFARDPGGVVQLRGQGNAFKVHGTALAWKLDFGGNGGALLSDCWVKNMSFSFMRYKPLTWGEIDR